MPYGSPQTLYGTPQTANHPAANVQVSSHLCVWEVYHILYICCCTFIVHLQIDFMCLPVCYDAMQCKYAAVDSLIHKECTDTDEAQTAACALHAHVDTSCAAAAKRTAPSLACATPRQPPAQHQRSEKLDPAGKLVVTLRLSSGRVTRWRISLALLRADWQNLGLLPSLRQQPPRRPVTLTSCGVAKEADQGSASLPTPEQVISSTLLPSHLTTLMYTTSLPAESRFSDLWC